MDYSPICDICLEKREFCINCNTSLRNKISYCIDGLHFCGICKDKMDRLHLIKKKE
jgi:hypothetical protein